MKVTVFERFTLNRGDHSLDTILEAIGAGRWSEQIVEIRRAREAGDNERADRLKRQLPAFTLSATYEGARKTANIIQYNGLIILDVDHLDPDSLRRAADRAASSPYTVFCLRSPSGEGLKIGVNPAPLEEAPLTEHPLTVENHKATFQACATHYEALLGVTVDPSGKDPGRLCFVSWDSEIFINRDLLKTPIGPIGPIRPISPKTPSTPSTPKPPLSPKTLNALKRARQRTSAHSRYKKGNRNYYVFTFACNCRKASIAWDDVLAYCLDRFSDLPEAEIRSAMDSGFSTVERQEAEDLKDLKDVKQDSKAQLIARTEAWLLKHYQLRFNVITHFVEYRRRRSKKPFVALDDQAENSLWRALQHEGIPIRLNVLHTVLMSDFCPRFDPVRDYFESLPPWDGQTDAIRELAATVEIEGDAELWHRALRRFLVAMVASALEADKVNHTILVLASDQGTGKTTWLLNLLPPELHAYRYSGIPNLRDKDALQILARCLLLNLDELGTLSMKDMNLLKEITTKHVLHFRPAYGRNMEHFPRLASLTGSVNTTQVFSDSTGSRRLALFQASRIDYQRPVDYTTLYAQVMALYRDGFRYWLDNDEISEINRHNEAFRIFTPEEEIFQVWVRQPRQGETARIEYLAASQILASLCHKVPLKMDTSATIRIGLMLKKEGFEGLFRNGRRVYKVVIRTLDEVSDENEGKGTPPANNTDKPDNEPDLFR